MGSVVSQSLDKNIFDMSLSIRGLMGPGHKRRFRVTVMHLLKNGLGPTEAHGTGAATAG